MFPINFFLLRDNENISILPPQKGLEFPRGGGSVRPKNLKKSMKLNWNFQRGGGSWKKSLHALTTEEKWKYMAYGAHTANSLEYKGF